MVTFFDYKNPFRYCSKNSTITRKMSIITKKGMLYAHICLLVNESRKPTGRSKLKCCAKLANIPRINIGLTYVLHAIYIFSPFSDCVLLYNIIT